eukprot:7474076-Pyramimonas_sp.AAC.2
MYKHEKRRAGRVMQIQKGKGVREKYLMKRVLDLGRRRQVRQVCVCVYVWFTCARAWARKAGKHSPPLHNPPAPASTKPGSVTGAIKHPETPPT